MWVLEVVALVLCTCFFGFTGLFSFYLLWRFYCQSEAAIAKIQDIKVIKRYRRWAIAATLCFGLMCFCQGARDGVLCQKSMKNASSTAAEPITKDASTDDLAFVLDMFTISFRCLTIVTVLFFQIMRLQEAFGEKEKTSNKSKCQITILKILSIIATIGAFVTVVIGEYVIDGNNYAIYYLCGIFTYILTITIPLIIARLFHKSFEMGAVAHMRQIQRVSNEEFVNEINANELKKQKKEENAYFELMAKQTLLAFWEAAAMMVGALMLFASYCLLFIWSHSIDEYIEYYDFYPAGIFIFCLNGVIVILCVWFSFSFTKNDYLCMCHPCHKKLLSCCRERARHSIANEMNINSNSNSMNATLLAPQNYGYGNSNSNSNSDSNSNTNSSDNINVMQIMNGSMMSESGTGTGLMNHDDDDDDDQDVQHHYKSMQSNVKMTT